jgi:DNA adenine methylase
VNISRLNAARLSDLNRPLMDVYFAVREDAEEVIRFLKTHKHNKRYFYALRAVQPETLSLPERAARIIYLNKTCYNGLYRENRQGQFNVPFGRYKHPLICDEPNLRAVSAALRQAELACASFASVLDAASAGDMVYFDPPYHPLSTTANFTFYDRSGFGEEEQRQLQAVFAELTRRNVRVMLSNSDTPLIRRLYAGNNVARVQVGRAINSRADRRGKVAEVIVRNYD